MSTAGADSRASDRLRALAAPTILFVVALAMRVAYVLEVKGSIEFSSPNMDAFYYDQMAQGYAAGLWLPDHAFWYAPLYPYFVGVVYSLFGRSLFALAIVQAILGAVNVVVISAIGTRLFDRRVGLLAGAIAAFYPLFLFYEATPSKDAFSMLLFDAALLLLLVARDHSHDRKPLAWLAASGAMLGVAVLSRGNFLLHVPLFAIAAFAFFRSAGTRHAIVAAAVTAGAALLAISPATIVNAAVSKDFVLVSYNGGPVLYTGNCPWNLTGSQINVSAYFPTLDPARNWNELEEEFFVKEAERETGRGLKPSEVSSHWSREARRWAFENPGRALALLWKKVSLYFNWYEVPNNDDYAFTRREYAPLLRLPLPSFGLLCPIGLVGLALALRRPRGGFLAPAVFAIDALSVILFFVISRYRITAMPILIVGAALAIVTLVDFVRERRLVPVGAMVVAGSLLALFVNRNLGDEPPNLSEGYRIRALKRLASDRAGALEDANRSIEEDPKNYEAYRLRARLRLEDRDIVGGIEDVESAIRCEPPWPTALELILFLAQIHERRGEVDEAIGILERARDQAKKKSLGGVERIESELSRLKKT